MNIDNIKNINPVFKYLVYVHYGRWPGEEGMVISRHRTYKLAEKKARTNSHWGIAMTEFVNGDIYHG